MRSARKRVAAGANDEDHQHLSRQRFDEPAGLEQRLVRVQHREQHVESEEIEQRTDRPDDPHEVADEGHVPGLRAANLLRVDVVERDRHFGKIVEHVVEQDLRRQHRQEGQEYRGGRHAEHVAEVGAGAHHDVLADVGEGAPAFEHAVVQHLQVALEQDQIGRFLGHIHRRIDRQAHVRRMQRRRIVDAVAEIADDVAARLEREDDAVLLRRVHAAKQIDCVDPSLQRVIVQLRDLVLR